MLKYTFQIFASFFISFLVLAFFAVAGAAADDKGSDKVPSSIERQGPQAGERAVLVWEDMEIYFRWCPPGTFTMGSPDHEAGRFPGNWERKHEVQLTQGFWMLETEVTQRLYQKVVGNNSSFYQSADHPVERIGFPQCVAFCSRFSELTRTRAVVPTEAQWEYACRAGKSEPWNFGTEPEGKGRFCIKDNDVQGTVPAASYPPNAWGLYDMHGNVAEWVSDWFDPDYYLISPAVDPRGTEKGSNKILRGGGWSSPAKCCRSAFRNLDVEPYACASSYGFRFIIVPSSE